MVAGRLGHHAGASPAVYRQALAAGFDRGFLITAGVVLLALLVAVAAPRRRAAAV